MSHLSLPLQRPPLGQSTELNTVGRCLREAIRPFRPRTWRAWKNKLLPPKPIDFPFEQGSTTPEDLALIRRLVSASKEHPGPIVEIGTLFGRTTTHIALFKAPEQKIITVDTYTWNPCGLSPDKHYALTSQILSYLVETGHVEQRRQNKNLFYATYRGPAPSLVFLDAIHTYEETKKDIEWAKSVGAKIIAGHDYCDRFPGVQRIVHEHGGPKEVSGFVFLLP